MTLPRFTSPADPPTRIVRWHVIAPGDVRPRVAFSAEQADRWASALPGAVVREVRR